MSGMLLMGVDAAAGGGGGGGYAIVAHTAAQGTSGGVTTSAINTSGANLIVLASVFFGGSAEPTISDNKGNTWVQLTKWGNGAASKVRFYYCASPTVGAGHTFTSTGASSFPALAVVALSGAGVAPFDAENGGGATQPGSVTPAGSSEILLSAITDDNAGSEANAVDSGFTILDRLTNVSGTAFGVALAYLIEGPAAAQNPTWSGGSGGSVSNLAAFK